MKNTMDYLTIALPKGKLFSLSADLLAKAGYTAEGLSDKSRKLVISNEEKKIRFIVSKTADVPTYVEYGAADIGVIGKDVLLESGKDVYELLDLGFGRCHLMMAVLSLQLAQQVQQVVGLAIALDAKAPAFTFDPCEDVPTKLSFTIQPGRFGAVEFQFRGTDEPKCLHANGGAYDLKPGLKLHTAATLHFEPEEIDRIAELDFTQYDETAVDNLLAGNEAKTDQALANAILEPFRLQVSTAAVVNAEI